MHVKLVDADQAEEMGVDGAVAFGPDTLCTEGVAGLDVAQRVLQLHGAEVIFDHGLRIAGVAEVRCGENGAVERVLHLAALQFGVHHVDADAAEDHHDE